MLETINIYCKDFNEDLILKEIKENENVFFYFYNDRLKKDLSFIMNKNIEDIEFIHKINKTIKVNVKDISKIENMFKENFPDTTIKLPLIVVFKQEFIVEFLSDCILIKK